jgi:hypothetical protein
MMPGCLCAPPSRLHPFCRMVSWCTCLGEEQVGNVTKQEGRRIVFLSASFFISLYFGPPQCLRLATAFGASGQGHGMSYPYAVQLLLDLLFLLCSAAPFACGPYIYDRIGQCWKRVVLGRLGGCATVLRRPPLLAVPAGCLRPPCAPLSCLLPPEHSLHVCAGLVRCV